MKRQDLHPYHSAILGMDDIYVDMGEEGFYVNLPTIIGFDKNVITGDTYILALSNDSNNRVFKSARLIDVYYMQDTHSIYFILKLYENNANVQICFNLYKDKPEPFEWKLIDWNFICKTIEDRIIMDYCGCAGESSSSATNKDDLLEFE